MVRPTSGTHDTWDPLSTDAGFVWCIYYRDGCRQGCAQIDRTARADSRNFDLQEVRLVVAIKMPKTTYAVSESPQKNNLARSVGVLNSVYKQGRNRIMYSILFTHIL